MRSIEYLFHSISTDQFRTNSTPSILSLFTHMPLDLADTTLKSMFADGRLTGERLSNMIRYLIVLIDAPTELLQSMSYETWITGLCNALVTFHQHEYLRNLIDESTPFFLDHLFHDQTFDHAFQILFWFILYDKRLEPFRMLVDRLPKLFERFQLHDHVDRKTRLIELCQMAMAIHPDHQISNGMLFKEILRTLPQPDLNTLANHRATHARFHSMISENKPKMKHRLGIINLGNTCYMNSVLQALYQCDLFRKYILEHHFHEQMVLKELQMIFGQLYLSKRPFINAVHLMKIARPAWFTMNEQQDCAEFLGYLLDTIKDEEKKDRHRSSNEIERFFSIRTCQINRCHTCRIESYREELSNYLFLPIPTGNLSNETKDSNHSAIPISITRNGLKFSAAFNDNSTSEDHVKSLVNALVQPDQISQSSSSPPSYDSLINQSLNLQFVFDCYFQKEELKDENQYRCEHCRSLQDAERSIILQNAPEYLILSLNRFEYDKSNNIFRKVFTKINYPKVLHVPIHPSETTRNQSILTKYCLVLVIVHTGYTLHGGHYYVYAREVKASLTVNEQDDYFTDDEWFLLNDDLVTSSSYEAMIENCAQYTSATPYILFYKRVDVQRMEDIERTKDIQVHEHLLAQIEEDNRLYEHERDVS